MIQLAFMLLGAEAIRRHWLVLGVIGLAWAALGLAIVTEAIAGIGGYTVHLLGLLLVIEGGAAVLAGVTGHRPRLWRMKAFALIVPGLVISRRCCAGAR